jgi:hypothetical protein
MGRMSDQAGMEVVHPTPPCPTSRTRIPMSCGTGCMFILPHDLKLADVYYVEHVANAISSVYFVQRYYILRTPDGAHDGTNDGTCVSVLAPRNQRVAGPSL